MNTPHLDDLAAELPPPPAQSEPLTAGELAGGVEDPDHHPYEAFLLGDAGRRRHIGWTALVISVSVNMLLFTALMVHRQLGYRAPQQKTIRIFLPQAPPPPPPPPPPSPGRARPRPSEAKPPEESRPTQPLQIPKDLLEEPDDSGHHDLDIDGPGTGDDPAGVAEGVEGGIAGGKIGGVVGGVIGGVLGGVLGGTGWGDIPEVIDASQIRLVRKVDPDYPPQARRQGIAGVVIVEAVVERNGQVGSARVVRSIPELDAAAVAAVKQWEFEPPRRGASAIRAKVTVMVRFDLVAS